MNAGFKPVTGEFKNGCPFRVARGFLGDDFKKDPACFWIGDRKMLKPGIGPEFRDNSIYGEDETFPPAPPPALRP